MYDVKLPRWTLGWLKLCLTLKKDRFGSYNIFHWIQMRFNKNSNDDFSSGNLIENPWKYPFNLPLNTQPLSYDIYLTSELFI